MWVLGPHGGGRRIQPFLLPTIWRSRSSSFRFSSTSRAKAPAARITPRISLWAFSGVCATELYSTIKSWKSLVISVVFCSICQPLLDGLDVPPELPHEHSHPLHRVLDEGKVPTIDFDGVHDFVHYTLKVAGEGPPVIGIGSIGRQPQYRRIGLLG